MTIWYILFIWYIFSGLGIMYQEKSGNPDWDNFFHLVRCKELGKRSRTLWSFLRGDEKID
jgi:hypothetical protein